jgi:hypothetical protein
MGKAYKKVYTVYTIVPAWIARKTGMYKDSSFILEQDAESYDGGYWFIEEGNIGGKWEKGYAIWFSSLEKGFIELMENAPDGEVIGFRCCTEK